MTLVFVHTHTFVADWARLKLNEEDLRQLELLILDRPDAGALMRRTGGVRKIRFAPTGRGKSGAFRVIYGYFPAYQQVYLLIAFGKNEQSNLTAAEQAACRELMTQISDYLKQRSKP